MNDSLGSGWWPSPGVLGDSCSCILNPKSYDSSPALLECFFRAIGSDAPYAVTADGQRFLINAVVDTEPNARLTVVVNWAAKVKK